MLVNLLVSIVLKAVQAALGFATIHALVHIWGTDRYGLWVTFTSVATYLTMFDLGIGYGIRNKVAEAKGALAIERAEEAVRLGTAFYAFASAVGLIAAAALTATVRPFDEHVLAAALLWTGCVLAFFLSIHSIILQALGRFRLMSIFSLLTPGLWYAFVKLWPMSSPLSIEVAAFAYATCMLVQSLALAGLSIRTQHFRILRKRPIDWIEAKSLISTGVQFFVLQLTTLALFNSGNFFVYTYLGPTETAHYDAANKVFSVFTLGFSLLIGIAWTEISKAKAKSDYRRLLHVFYALHGIAFLLLALAVTCAVNAPLVVRSLTGISISSAEAMPFAAMVGCQALAFSSAVYLNAYERLRAQIITALLALPIFIALAYWLLRSGHGIGSIPASTAIALLPSLLVCATTAWRVIGSQRPPFGGLQQA